MKLSTRQKNKLKEHSAHHTKGHMDYMKRKMREGMSFRRAQILQCGEKVNED